MIKADKANNPSAYILKRSAKMIVERMGPTEFRVTPSEEGKAVRIVRFHPDYGEGAPRDRYLPVGTYGPAEISQMRDVFIECFAENTKKSCPANIYGGLCSHAFSAISFLLDVTKGESDVTE